MVSSMTGSTTDKLSLVMRLAEGDVGLEAGLVGAGVSETGAAEVGAAEAWAAEDEAAGDGEAEGAAPVVIGSNFRDGALGARAVRVGRSLPAGAAVPDLGADFGLVRPLVTGALVPDTDATIPFGSSALGASLIAGAYWPGAASSLSSAAAVISISQPREHRDDIE
jgi:hypothetical protein